MTTAVEASSYRDPSGFLFTRAGVLYRQVNAGYREDYDLLMSSGLYAALVERGWLVAHAEVEEAPADLDGAYRVLRPEVLPVITYPYEWCFSQLQDAALLTLEIQTLALAHGMLLKDASAYNVQFHHGRPCFIDTLSFTRYREGLPWVAYRQFCEHFLAPLALMAHTDVRLAQLQRAYLDGIPLDLASRLLPGRTRWQWGLLLHLHLHANAQLRHADDAARAGGGAAGQGRLSLIGLQGLLSSLAGTVKGLRWQPAGTEWADYYTATNYTDEASRHKAELVADYLTRCAPALVWDLGANDGTYSRLASDRGILTVAFDIDPAAVEKNYRAVRARSEHHLLPLLLDLTNPSPGTGWGNAERAGWQERGRPDTIVALALLHHLAIGHNVPLARIAALLAELAPTLIIEFVPKADSQVQRMLATREDIFADYHREGFERAMGTRFLIDDCQPIHGSARLLYLLRRKEAR
jgi:hypothetical protein